MFDGHGPSGHVVAKYIRDYLPSKISTTSGNEDHDNGDKNNNNNNVFLNLWKNRILQSFSEIDEDLEGNSMVESYCSGTTAVTVIKQVNKQFHPEKIRTLFVILIFIEENQSYVPERSAGSGKSG